MNDEILSHAFSSAKMSADEKQAAQNWFYNEFMPSLAEPKETAGDVFWENITLEAYRYAMNGKGTKKEFKEWMHKNGKRLTPSGFRECPYCQVYLPRLKGR